MEENHQNLTASAQRTYQLSIQTNFQASRVAHCQLRELPAFHALRFVRTQSSRKNLPAIGRNRQPGFFAGEQFQQHLVTGKGLESACWPWWLKNRWRSNGRRPSLLNFRFLDRRAGLE